MKAIFRFLVFGAGVIVAYKVGEKKAQLSSINFLIARNFDTAGILQTEFIYITPAGQIDYTQDESQATAFNFYEAQELKRLIKRFTPGANLVLITEQQTNLI